MPESLELPIFDEPYGQFLSACGLVVAKDRHTLALIAAAHRKFVVARVGKGRSAEYVGLRENAPGASNRHLHMDAGTASYIKSVSPRPVSISRIAALVSPLYGQRVHVFVEALFEVPWAQLPAEGIVRSTLLSMDAGEMPVRQTGATLVVGREPDEVKYSFHRSHDLLRAQIELSADTTIDASYLKNLHRLAFSAFSGLILEQEQVPDEVRRSNARRRTGLRKRARRAMGRS